MKPTHTRIRFELLILTLLVSLLFASCQLQTPVPSPRYGACMVFNPLEAQGILFGGRAHGFFGGKYFNDLWVLDAATHTWMSIKNSDPPEPHMNPGMVYDSANHQIILFGGLVKKDRLGDAWVFAISDNHCQERSPEYSPPPRSDTGMVYDEHSQEVILFGGY